MERYLHRVAVVSGAASGIGAAVCTAFVQNGIKVAGLDLDCSRLEEMTTLTNANAVENGHQGKMFAFTCDVTNEDDVVRTLSKVKQDIGSIDVCLCAAGVSHKAPILTGSSEHFHHIWNVNVMGYIYCCQQAYKQMLNSHTNVGHLILINSGAGHHVRSGSEEMTHFNFYNATKYAITAITEGIRCELRMKKSNIRATQISPGIVETPFTHRMYPGEEANVDELYKRMKCLEPKDVAAAVLHVLSQPAHVEVNDVFVSPLGQTK